MKKLTNRYNSLVWLIEVCRRNGGYSTLLRVIVYFCISLPYSFEVEGEIIREDDELVFEKPKKLLQVASKEKNNIIFTEGIY